MALSLKIDIVRNKTTKTLQFDPKTTVSQAISIIRDKVPDANVGQITDYGLYRWIDDPKKGIWLESGRGLDFYPLKNGDLLEYRDKHRYLKVKTLDNTVKTILIDDSQTVGEILNTVCNKLGIGNMEEFSLMVENFRDEKEELQEKTLSLRRDKTMKDASIKKIEERDRKKMELLKKKLHTDDEVHWLDLDKTLREQGVDDAHTITLRRKYFYSDQNVDVKDPVQLNLLYVQSRDGIIDGTHPCTIEEAIQFAALQIQIQYGDYEEQWYKTGVFDVKEVLPKEYVKIKNVDKKIKEEHKTILGLDDLQAKHRYVQLCRGLKTYGVTFFLVKEKMKGKNKLTPRLLGVTKDSVLRVDEKTKEVLKTWPLTTVKRWAASPNSFTLDFGDYLESYYSVQTNEGEKISQLIAGYIDIILRKRRGQEGFDPDFDEESTMLEDSVAPSKGTILERQTSKIGHASQGSVALPAVMRAGGQGASSYSVGQMQQAQFSTMTGAAKPGHAPPMGQSGMLHGPSQAQQAYISNLGQSLDLINDADKDLRSPADVPPLGSDPASLKWKQNTLDVSKQNVSSRLAALSASTASIVTLTSGEPEETNYTAAGAAVNTISANLQDLTKGIKMIAALYDDDNDGNKLLDAARNLADAFSNLLKAAQIDNNKDGRQKLLGAAGDVGTAGAALLQYMGEPDVDEHTQEMLLQLAQAVANTTAVLVLKAKNIASTCDDTAQQNKVIGAAKNTAMMTSQLLACTKVVAPAINSHLCQEQVVEAARLVAKCVEDTQSACQEASKDPNMLNDLGQAANAVTEALNNLLKKVREGSKVPGGKYDDTCDDILGATDRLFNSMGNAGEMVKQAKVLAQATSHLVNGIRAEADTQEDSDSSKKLLAAAKLLADATANMVEAAKNAARNPNDANKQKVLRQAAVDLRSASNTAANNALKKKLMKRLENTAKEAATVATQLMAASQGATPSNRNPASQQQLLEQCKPVGDQIGTLVQAIRNSMKNPDSPSGQLGLIDASKNFIQPGAKLIASSKAAIPTVGDQACSMQLSKYSKATAEALTELRDAANKAHEACSSLEIDSALDTVNHLMQDLTAIERSAETGNLLPLPGESAEACALELGATSKTVGSSMAQLLTAAVQGNENYTGIAARDTASALKVLTGATRGVAAGTKDKPVQRAMIRSTLNVMLESSKLIGEAKMAIANPGDPNKQQKLSQVAKQVSEALKNVVNCLPGQKDVDDAIKKVNMTSQDLNTPGQLPSSQEPYQQVQDKLNTYGAALNVAASELVSASRGNASQLATSSRKFSESFQDFVDVGKVATSQTKDEEVKATMVKNLKNTTTASSKLLLAVKSLSTDQNTPNAKNLLAVAARAVTDSINQLLNACMLTGPGQKECDNALRNIQATATMLDNPVEPVNSETFFDCLDNVTGKSKELSDVMRQVPNDLKEGSYEDFDKSVKKASDAITSLTESAAQAAYLVAISDPSSVAGRPGLLDQGEFDAASQAVISACDVVMHPASTQTQILQSATAITKNTSALCQICKLASNKTDSQGPKRHFIQAAKDVANNTANVVKAIKEFATNNNPSKRQACIDATKPLFESVNNLSAFAKSPEFSAVPARISKEARSTQVPLIMAGKSLVISGTNYINNSKAIGLNPNDQSAWQQLSQHCKALSDAMKKLIQAIKTNAPGQQECDEAIDNINRTINAVDQASLAAMSKNLEPRQESTLQGFQEQLVQAISQIREEVAPLARAAKSQPQDIGHHVAQMARYIGPLANAAVGAASRMKDPQKQAELLDQTKTVGESAIQLLYATKDSGGNPKATHVHPVVDESAQGMKEALEDLSVTMEEAASESGMMTALVDSIQKASQVLEIPALENEQTDGFVDYQERMTKAMKELTKKSQDMVGKSSIDPSQLGGLGKEVSRLYAIIATNARGAVATVHDPEIGNRIQSSTRDLGDASCKLVQTGGAVQSNPKDPFAMKELADNARTVAEKVSNILAALQAGSRGTQACINAVATISGICSDLDTTGMFATAGTLDPENDEDNFADHREDILKTAKKLVEDTKTLVPAAQASQDHLANAAQASVASVSKLADHVKLGAAALGTDDMDAQVLLLNAAKDVASALSNLINATKNCSGKGPQDPSMDSLKHAAKSMVTSVSSLLMTVKSVEDKATRGMRALESSTEAIKQAIIVLNSSSPPVRDATPEDLIRSTKGVTLATAKAVAAGNSGNQEEVIAAANLGRKAVTEMLIICKGASRHAETEPIRVDSIIAGRECGTAYNNMLELVINVVQKPTPDKKQKLSAMSKTVADSVGNLVKKAETLKGSEWVNPEDPNVIAENELLGAASAIEAAARKLAELKPRQRPRQADESLNFEEQILEAAKAIASATSILVKAASAAQRELVATGRVCSAASDPNEDGQWSQGLVSAARMVATGTSSLCEAANAAVQGNASEERLIASAKAVANSTAQLLLSCRVKADSNSASQRRLQIAGNAVKKAADDLVKAAQKAAIFDAEDTDVVVNQRFVGGIAQEIQAQEEILRKERELQVARERLAKIRQAKYRPEED